MQLFSFTNQNAFPIKQLLQNMPYRESNKMKKNKLITILLLCSACGKTIPTSNTETKNTITQNPNARIGRLYNTPPGNFTGNFKGTISITNGTRIGNGLIQILIIQKNSQFKTINLKYQQSGLNEQVTIPALNIYNNDILSSDFEQVKIGKIDQNGFTINKLKDIKLSIEIINEQSIQLQFSVNNGSRNFKTGSGTLSRINP